MYCGVDLYIAMRTNHTFDRLKRGQKVFGCGIQSFRSAEVPRLLAAAGFDFAFIDVEHGAFNFETVADMVLASVNSGITPVVRAGELLYSLVARLLDVGAQGIVLPRVEDPALLKEALSWMKYPPLGKRGYGILPAYKDYGPESMAEVIAHLNANTMSVVQFETVLALERAEELLSLNGVDVIMVGPADLSVSMGIPGEMDHPRLVAALDRLIEQCNAHGVVPGIHSGGGEQAKFWAARGMRLVGAGGEHSLLMEKACEVVGMLNPLRAAAGREA